MNSEGRPSNSADKDGQPSSSWLERISQALLREPKDRDQLLWVLRDAQQRQLIDTDSLNMIEGVLDVYEMRVRDIMVPRNQMVVVERDDAPATYLPILIESAHSRFPVVGEGKDDVVGILLAKDLLSYFARGDGKDFDIREVLRPAVFIPESKRLNVLLREFRSSRNHMAVVVDEYGGVAGLVTIEDVLEQIVGDIEDEHDIDDDTYIIKRNDGSYTLKALTPIEDFNEYFTAELADDEFDTVGGLIMQHLARLPKAGETVEMANFRFKVLRADSRRIHLLQVSRLAADDESVPTLP